MSPLMFRKEVLFHNCSIHGPILLTRPVSFTLLTTFFAALAGMIITFFFTFSVTATASLSGVLLPADGLIRIVPMQGGLIAANLVREGQHVKAGDVLFMLRSERANGNGSMTEAIISALLRSRQESLELEAGHQSRQAEQRITVLLRRIEDLRGEQQHMADQIVRQQKRISFSEAGVERYRQLREENFASDAAVEEKRADLLDQRHRLAEMQRSAFAVRREFSETQAQLQDLRIQQQRDHEAIQRNVATLNQELAENEARREIVIKSPEAGTVSGILVEAGQTAAAGQPLATLVPAGSKLEATLYAPSRSAGFVRAGMPVRVRFPAYPYQKFGHLNGRVLAVSASTVAPSELASLARPLTVANEPLYLVRVALEHQSIFAYGIHHSLKPGMALDASVQLERRRLYEWVLQPAFSIAGQL